MKKKIIVSAIAIVLVLCCAIGGTLAWLTDATDEIVNTFTVGNVGIGLAETTEDYKMIPGSLIAKDPTVTVEEGSEDCWLFVKVDKSVNFDDFMTYSMAEGWTSLEGVDGVYYREAKAGDSFPVLVDNISDDGYNGSVAVKDTVTQDMMDEITDGTADEPTLTFTAYAIQKAGFVEEVEGVSGVERAWIEVSE